MSEWGVRVVNNINVFQMYETESHLLHWLTCLPLVYFNRSCPLSAAENFHLPLVCILHFNVSLSRSSSWCPLRWVRVCTWMSMRRVPQTHWSTSHVLYILVHLYQCKQYEVNHTLPVIFCFCFNKHTRMCFRCTFRYFSLQMQTVTLKRLFFSLVEANCSFKTNEN